MKKIILLALFFICSGCTHNSVETKIGTQPIYTGDIYHTTGQKIYDGIDLYSDNPVHVAQYNRLQKQGYECTKDSGLISYGDMACYNVTGYTHQYHIPRLHLTLHRYAKRGAGGNWGALEENPSIPYILSGNIVTENKVYKKMSDYPYIQYIEFTGEQTISGYIESIRKQPIQKGWKFLGDHIGTSGDIPSNITGYTTIYIFNYRPISEPYTVNSSVGFAIYHIFNTQYPNKVYIYTRDDITGANDDYFDFIELFQD